jgi:predicted transcriptional regulator of viral defense system
VFDISALPARAFPARDLPQPQLRALIEAGAIERIGWGIYRRMDLPPADLDLIEIGARSSLATLCLASALARHELIDEIPARIDIAIPRTARIPRSDAPIRWHYFDAGTFNLGRTLIPIDGEDAQIGIYSPERSIIDAFRLRGSEGYEMATEALSNWLKRRGSHPAALLQIAAQLPRATTPLIRALNVLS